jgi:hypothetical protein
MVQDYFNISQPTLQKIIKQVTGHTFQSYVETSRLNKARELLQESNYSIREIYEKCGFSNKTAFVVAVELERGKIIAIDKNNKKLFTVFNFDNAPDYIEDGLFRIVNDSTGYIGFADMQGNIIISPRFFHVDSFSEGFAAFNVGGEFEPDGEYTAVLGGKWGYIDNTGKEVFPAIFDKASPFKNGKARVQIGEDVFLLIIEVYNKK